MIYKLFVNSNTIIPPGDYTIKVKSINEETGVSGRPVHFVEFELIEPPDFAERQVELKANLFPTPETTVLARLIKKFKS